MATSESELKEKALRLVREFVVEGNFDIVEEHFAEDYVGSSNAVPEPYGRDGIKEIVSMIRTGFPDLEPSFDDVYVDGNTVIRVDRFKGTHEGEFMGIEPTGNEVEVLNVVIERFDEDGKIVEEHLQIDMMGILQQLGVVEPPGQ